MRRSPPMPTSQSLVFVRRLARVVGAPAKGAIQRSNISLLALSIVVVAWRFAAAVAFPRAAPVAALAALSQALRNGFFLSQGLDIEHSFWSPSGDSSLLPVYARPECQGNLTNEFD